MDRVLVSFEMGADPVRGGTIRANWDKYFANSTARFYLIFTDGQHTAGQVLRNVSNSRSRLRPGGVIVLHNGLPGTDAQQQPTP